MPFKSEAQRRFFHAAEARGELPKGTAARWEKDTPKKRKLPMHVKSASFEAGAVEAMSKIARLPASQDTTVLTMKELLAVRDPAERKRYLADMAAKNHRVAQDKNSTTRAAVVAQSPKGA